MTTVRPGHVRSRVLADWAWAKLDREIAAGLPIEASEARLLRAQRLLHPQERRAIAAVLANIVDAADAASRSGKSAVPGEYSALVASHDRLVLLIGLLRSEASMTAPAVAGAELLACDRNSPLVSRHDDRATLRALDEIAIANIA
jgi:hypothetical protein